MKTFQSNMLDENQFLGLDQSHGQQNIEQNKVRSHQKKEDHGKNLSEQQECGNDDKHEDDPGCTSSDESV